MKCEYPKCEAEAKFKLGLADPDSEGNYYCEGHVDIEKSKMVIELFGWGNRTCIAIKPNNTQCSNQKKFGDYCGIHNKEDKE